MEVKMGEAGATPGLRIERRMLLALGAGAPLLLQPAGARAAPSSTLSYDAFIAAAASELAAQLPADGRIAQDAYVFRAAALLRRLDAPPPVAFVETRRLDIKPIAAATKLFSITVLRAKPGVVQPPHNHPLYSVATMGLTGEVRVRNFEPQGAPPAYASKAPFKLRQTAERRLVKGDVSTLAPDRDNFHTFEAGPDGATWMDISTAHGVEGAGDFSYLRLLPGPASRVGDVFDARWGLKD